MNIDRRRLVRLGTLASVVPATGAGVPEAQRHAWTARAVADMPEPDLAALMLNRAAFGARPGELESVRQQGVAAWLEAQLEPGSIDDRAVETVLASQVPSLIMPTPELWALYQEGSERNAVRTGLRVATLYRQLFSQRQLFEVMVDFWSDHFSIDQNTPFSRVLKTIDDREVVRAHALGRFKDLVTASAQSPSMLNYLDNDANTKRKPNENYARELLELHTLGVAVDGQPYTEEDVLEVARCLTGWSWNNGRQDPEKGGLFEFKAGNHDQGLKRVLGTVIPANTGAQDGHLVIDLLCQHPATARFIATKLVRRFVADEPVAAVPELVDRVAQAFLDSDGDTKTLLRTILLSDEFAVSFASHGGRLSRPMDHVVRCLRVAGLSQDDLGRDFELRRFRRFASRLIGGGGFLTAMNHVPFTWETPDGFPDYKEKWTSTGILLARWNFGLSLAEGSLLSGWDATAARPADLGSSGEIVDFWVEALIHRGILAADRELLVDYLSNGAGETAGPAAGREAYLLGLIIDSPYFLWR